MLPISPYTRAEWCHNIVVLNSAKIINRKESSKTGSYVLQKENQTKYNLNRLANNCLTCKNGVKVLSTEPGTIVSQSAQSMHEIHK